MCEDNAPPAWSPVGGVSHLAQWVSCPSSVIPGSGLLRSQGMLVFLTDGFCSEAPARFIPSCPGT